MKIVRQSKLPDGSYFRIEDWHEDYNFYPPASFIAVYIISQWSMPGAFAPEAGKECRFSFHFDSPEETLATFERLERGEMNLRDIAHRMRNRNYAKCLG